MYESNIKLQPARDRQLSPLTNMLAENLVGEKAGTILAGLEMPSAGEERLGVLGCPDGSIHVR